MPDHIQFMHQALLEAKFALEEDEVPIGAIVTFNDKVIGRGYNSVIKTSDPTQHAEIVALRDAAKQLANYRLPEVSLYVTLEPCIMCLGAIFHARVKHVFFGAYDPKFHSCDPNQSLINNRIINHHTTAQGGILEQECAELLSNYFKHKR